MLARRARSMFFALAVVLSMAGCLSLGGGTTYVQEKPETAERISSLESRVGALEQMLPRSGPEEIRISSPR